MRSSLFIFVMVVFLTGPAPQRAEAASVYSMVLVGERVESGDVRAIALGGSAQLISDSLGVLYSNPALLSRTRAVTLGITQVLAMDEGRSDDYTERDNSFLFPTLKVSFPIMGRFVLSTGYMSRYDPDGSFTLDGVTESGDEYTTRFTKSGGLFSVPLIIAADVTRFVSVGASFSFEAGNVEERWEREFEDPDFVPGAGFQREDLKGTSFGGGLVLRPFEKVMIGGSYQSEIDYETEVSRIFTNASLNTSSTSTAKLPARVSAAATVGLGSWLFLGSYAWSDFAEFEGFGFPTDRLGMETSYAFGVEYGGVSIGNKKLPIRVSFNYQELPFDHPRDSSIEKFLVGIGSGLIVRNGSAKFDFAIQAGKVGALNTNGLEDRLIRVYVGLVGAERWTRRAGRQ